MSDNKDLLDEIDKLDDNEETIKEGEEQQTSHEKAFTVIIVIIIIVALVILYLFYKGNYMVTSNKKNIEQDFSAYLEGFDDYTDDKDDDSDFEDFEEFIDYDELEKQELEKFEIKKQNLIITSQSLSIDNELIAVMHNGNQENISDVEVQVIFYNSENKPIKIDNTYIDVIEANSDYYMYFYETPETYSRCDFLFEKDFSTLEYKSYKSSIEFNVQEIGEDEIIISGKNNSNDEVKYLTFAVVYYNEANQIIGCEEFYNDEEIAGNKEFKIDAYKELYKFETDEQVPFARYEVILQDAYTEIDNI